MPPNAATKAFLAKPLEFMRKHSVSPPDGVVRQQTITVDPQGHRRVNYTTSMGTASSIPMDGMFSRFFRPGTSSNGEYKHVTVTQPVGWMSMEKSIDPRLAGAYTFTVELKPSEDRIPIYFLPWDSQRLIELTIPEKKTASDEEDDPYLFFTAAINGCSVFVRGDSRQPTISHAGISAGSTPYGNDASDFWRDLLHAHLAANNERTGRISEVNNKDYINQTGVSMGVGTANADRYRRILDRVPDGKTTITEVVPWGAVFGIRFGRLWSFYLQENATINRFRIEKKIKTSQIEETKKRLFGPDKVTVTTKHEIVAERVSCNVNKPMLVRPFFPGAGQVEFKPKFERV